MSSLVGSETSATCRSSLGRAEATGEILKSFNEIKNSGRISTPADSTHTDVFKRAVSGGLRPERVKYTLDTATIHSARHRYCPAPLNPPSRTQPGTAIFLLFLPISKLRNDPPATDQRHPAARGAARRIVILQGRLQAEAIVPGRLDIDANPPSRGSQADESLLASVTAIRRNDDSVYGAALGSIGARYLGDGIRACPGHYYINLAVSQGFLLDFRAVITRSSTLLLSKQRRTLPHHCHRCIAAVQVDVPSSQSPGSS